MKKWLILVIVLISLSGVFASGLLNCRKSCTIDNQMYINNCKNQFNNCSQTARYLINACSKPIKNITCVSIQKDFLNKCSIDKKQCLKQASEKYNLCNKKCYYANKNITCNGKYNITNRFADGCNICECLASGKINCKQSEFCNFNYDIADKLLCEESNGLFQQLCSGSIYSMKCTSEVYCQCGGIYNYTCPENYTCIYDFLLNLNKRGQFSQGWRKLPEIPIGNIGICLKNPDLKDCGNRICENIFNISSNQVPETKYNCPEDCN